VAVEGSATELGLAAEDAPDLLLLNDGDLTFAKIRLDDRSLTTARSHLRRLGDPLARALVWGSLWDACRDADLVAADFVETVLANVDGESDPAVVQALLGQARTAATLFTADGGPLVEALAEASRRAGFETAPPGSDLQLARVRAFAGTARSAHHAQVLEALLAGTVPPGCPSTPTCAGPWSRRSPASAGWTTPRSTPSGPATTRPPGGCTRLTARSAAPTAAAKERAWAAATGPDLTNSEVRAVTAGFWRPGQDELLAPYVDRYVAELPEVWARRSPEVAGPLAQSLFPSTLVAQDVLDRTAVLLEPAHPTGLRRYVAEQRHDLARALRARSAG
jgi:aminopeptidase N